MPDEQKPGEMPENEQATVTEAATVQPTETVEQLRARVSELEKRNKELNRESADKRHRLEALEAERKAADEAKLSDLEKAQKELAELRAEVQRRNTNDKKRVFAKEAGLPDALADRIKDGTDEEMKADAKALADILPKAEKPKPGATNPGAGGSTGPDAELRKLLLG